MGISLKAIVSKLNETTRTALEGAAGLCLARTHYDVEIEHFVNKYVCIVVMPGMVDVRTFNH